MAPGPPTVSYAQTKVRTKLSKKLAAKLEGLGSSNGVTNDDSPENNLEEQSSSGKVTVETLSSAATRYV